MVYREQHTLIVTAEDSSRSPIPDPAGESESQVAVVGLAISQAGSAQRVELTLHLKHARASDLGVTLVAPSGVRAVLYHQHPSDDLEHRLHWDSDTSTKLRTMLGQRSEGLWKLVVRDNIAGRQGQITFVRLRLKVVSPEREALR